MRALEPKHYLLLAGFLTAMSAQLAGLQHGWHDAMTTSFVAGILGQLGVMIGALYAGAPGATGQMYARSGEENTISKTKIPTGVPAILLALVLGSAVIFSQPACGAATQQVQAGQANTDQATRAAQVQPVIQRIGELQQAVIDLQGQGRIKTEDARVIVTWTVATLKLLKDAPAAGWATTAGTGWQAVRPVVLANANLAPWVGIVDQLLQGGF